jgi:hypothetical protein
MVTRAKCDKLPCKPLQQDNEQKNQCRGTKTIRFEFDCSFRKVSAPATAGTVQRRAVKMVSGLKGDTYEERLEEGWDDNTG